MATFYTDADLSGAGEFSDPELTLATEFTVPDGNVNWLRWRCPSTAPSVTPAFRIYDASNNLVATVPLDGAVVTSAWNQGTPGAPIALAAGTYRASINTTHYLALGGFFSGGPIVRGDITGVQGRFANGIAAPGGASASAYYVDIDFGDTPVAPAEGSAALGLDLAVSATGSRDSQGLAAVTIDLAVAAAGRRDSSGAATAGLALSVAATGARASQGASGVGLALAVAAAGARPSRGSVALTLNLALDARGPVAATPPSGPRFITSTDTGRLTTVGQPSTIDTSTWG